MTVLATFDFLADIQFIDYWDIEFLFNDTPVEVLADIQFIDYWDTDFLLKDWDDVSDNWDADVSLDEEDGDISFGKRDTFTQ